MSIKGSWRYGFDRQRDFIVRLPMTVGGKSFAAGEPFDKTLVSDRRLRLLYDSRRIMPTEALPDERQATLRERHQPAMRPGKPPRRARAGKAGGNKDAARLLAEADELRFFDFRARAEDILGKDKTPRTKDAIVAALGDLAKG